MPRLLVIDDHKNTLELYAQEFSDDGYDVDVAQDGKQAIDLIRQRRPDLVIMDICMPGMNGIHLIEKIMGIDRSIPVIINTAYSMHRDNFMTWTALDYVVKSGDLTDLKSSVERALAMTSNV